MKREHIPFRLCVVCGEMKPKKELVRLVRISEGNIELDANNALSGKGLYICNKIECLNNFISGKKFKRRYHPHLVPEVIGELKKLAEYRESENTAL